MVSHGIQKACLYTSNEVVRLFNNLEINLESNSNFENSSDCSCSSDDTEDETEGDSDRDATIIVDVVDDVTWSSMPVSIMHLDFTVKS